MAAGPAAAGAPQVKPGVRNARVFMLDGHGADCVKYSPTEAEPDRVTMDVKIVPKNKYFITIVPSGELSYYDTTVAQQSFISRDADWEKIPPKHTGSKEALCDSDYMEFKHKIARYYDIVYIILRRGPEAGGDYDLIEPFARDLVRGSALANKPLREYPKELKKILCEIYNRRIHVHYPGDTYVDNSFSPINYHSNLREKTAMIGAGGVIDRDAAMFLGTSFRSTTQMALYHSERETAWRPLEDFYRASVWPSILDIKVRKEFEKLPKTRAVNYADRRIIEQLYEGTYLPVSYIMDMEKPKASELLRDFATHMRELAAAATDEHDKEFNIEKSNEAFALAKALETTVEGGDRPEIYYYPVCRDVAKIPGAAAAVALRAAESLQQEVGEGGRRKRKTYRKKRRTRKTTRRTRQ